MTTGKGNLRNDSENRTASDWEELYGRLEAANRSAFDLGDVYLDIAVAHGDELLREAREQRKGHKGDKPEIASLIAAKVKTERPWLTRTADAVTRMMSTSKLNRAILAAGLWPKPTNPAEIEPLARLGRVHPDRTEEDLVGYYAEAVEKYDPDGDGDSLKKIVKHVADTHDPDRKPTEPSFDKWIATGVKHGFTAKYEAAIIARLATLKMEMTPAPYGPPAPPAPRRSRTLKEIYAESAGLPVAEHIAKPNPVAVPA